MQKPILKENWSEFDWEQELRKDDARVNRYVNELPRYIDLPDEDGVIMQRMKKSPELAPAGGDWSSLGPVPYDDNPPDESDEDPDDFRDSSDWKKADCACVYSICGELAHEWSLLFASHPELLPGTMTILTFYGKLIARSADVIDMSLDTEGEVESRAMRIALMKRLLSDINRQIGNLLAFEKEFSEICDRQTDALRELAEYLRDRIPAVRALGKK